ncbi:hypothetical protein B0H10DRAFT_2238935 [Mycena sp. CBHHK59/15]|nr:hypothetical protein B0H10DRAFT_2238935 [Mycena sp. CBHHK59/15]
MRLTEHDAWKVREAPSVYDGVDLLKNKLLVPDLTCPLDGRAAAYFEMGHTSYFIITNARYVPSCPRSTLKKLCDRFCHLAAIPRAPTSPRDQEELGVMWWNPIPADFVCPASGLTLTRGLGRLAGACFSKLANRTSALIDEYEQIPSTYIRMVVGVTTVQRDYLELPGLLRYMTKYKPRLECIDDPNANTAYPDDCIGCFTDDPRIAQVFWKMKPDAGFSPVPATDLLDDRISLVRRCTENTPWYRNPFGDASPTAGEQSAKAGPTRNVSSAPSSGKGSPYAAARAQAKAQKEAKGPNPNAKKPCDKFLPLDRPEMPTTITPWATALAAIDRSCPPSCGIDLPQLYVMPEPGLLASPEEEPRRRMLYHHYRLLRDALMFRLADRSQRHVLLTTQQWRDVLQGKVIKQGKVGTRAQARSASLEDLLRPAFSACGINALTEFPVPPEAVPPLQVHRTKELLWELAEINFRYEFLALDARASGLDRPRVSQVFCSEGLIGMDFRESRRGLAALEAMDRLPYLLCMAGLMCDWSVPCERSKHIDNAKGRTGWMLVLSAT